MASGPRIKQGLFLFKYVFFVPLWGMAWLLDEFLYPGYKKCQVKPIFIMGQPRSGTTFLHRTLALDQDTFIAIKHIEWRYPFIWVQQILTRSSLARHLIQKNYWSNSSAGQKASRMHPNNLSDWEEDGIFFEECFLHHFFIFLRFPYPHLLSYLDDFQGLPQCVQKKILKTHNQVIQKMIYFRGSPGQYYLSKEVTSHNKFSSMLQRYPDAKFIFSFRSSNGFMNSLIALVRVSTQSKIGVDPMDIPHWESAFINRMQKDSDFLVDFCEEKIEKHRQVRIMFNRFTKDLVFSISHIYGKLGLDMSKEYIEQLNHLHQGQTRRNKGYDYEKNTFQGFEKFDKFVGRVDQDFLKKK